MVVDPMWLVDVVDIGRLLLKRRKTLLLSMNLLFFFFFVVVVESVTVIFELTGAGLVIWDESAGQE